MIVLIDNYDSFSYNLYQLVGTLEPNIKVVRNDELTVDDLAGMNPQAILISPGPGRPKDAGICEQVVQELTGKVPILGVCLGHQAICEALGAKITYAKTLMHGKSSDVSVIGAPVGQQGNENVSPIFKGIVSPFRAARYHSLAVDETSMPQELRVTARADDGEIMAVEQVGRPTFGLQFHPESIMTPRGIDIMRNFISLANNYQ